MQPLSGRYEEKRKEKEREGGVISVLTEKRKRDRKKERKGNLYLGGARRKDKEKERGGGEKGGKETAV